MVYQILDLAICDKIEGSYSEVIRIIIMAYSFNDGYMKKG